jgi:hypothetical protein
MSPRRNSPGRNSPKRNDDESIEAISSVLELAASPIDNLGSPDWTEFEMRVAALRAQELRSQQLIEYCDETVAAIRASLERTLNGSGRRGKQN